eukprot:NODE_9516_length_1418_cov_5.520527.p1 GENE.NODE_9516_length_1418_cov_5.520527~~NODE_9516_length_1418_cov_5.520527.p1  ORF type:complete len:390 (-),score=86.50 NODE_9516_length_1418_cov_5.520527:249-1376(-)
MDHSFVKRLYKWVESAHSHHKAYDHRMMMEMIDNGAIPRTIMADMPSALYGGQLTRNKFLTVLPLRENSAVIGLPPRLPLLLSLSTTRHRVEVGEFVYETGDHPAHLFLVMSGIFAAVATPTDVIMRSGQQRFPAMMEEQPKKNIGRSKLASQVTGASAQLTSEYPYKLFGSGSYFGEVELLRSCQRLSSVRCESVGETLILNRQNFVYVMSEFPAYAKTWQLEAARHEKHRISLLQNHKVAMSFRHLAAHRLQVRVRLRKRICARNVPNTPSAGGVFVNCLLGAAGLRTAADIDSTSPPIHATQARTASIDYGDGEKADLREAVFQLHEEVHGLRAEFSAHLAALTSAVSVQLSAEAPVRATDAPMVTSRSEYV